MWMGIFWIGLGIFFLISGWLKKGGFTLPHLQINLGWIVITLGIFRIWWWKKTVVEPTQRRLRIQEELRQMEREQQIHSSPSTGRLEPLSSAKESLNLPGAAQLDDQKGDTSKT